MAEHIIRLQGVTKEFDTKGGKVVALKDIDLDIERGDSYGIIGLSGAGKSTLVRTINLLEQPTEGKVIFNGSTLTGLKRFLPFLTRPIIFAQPNGSAIRV